MSQRDNSKKLKPTISTNTTSMRVSIKKHWTSILSTRNSRLSSKSKSGNISWTHGITPPSLWTTKTWTYCISVISVSASTSTKANFLDIKKYAFFTLPLGTRFTEMIPRKPASVCSKLMVGKVQSTWRICLISRSSFWIIKISFGTWKHFFFMCSVKTTVKGLM